MGEGRSDRSGECHFWNDYFPQLKFSTRKLPVARWIMPLSPTCILCAHFHKMFENHSAVPPKPLPLSSEDENFKDVQRDEHNYMENNKTYRIKHKMFVQHISRNYYNNTMEIGRDLNEP